MSSVVRLLLHNLYPTYMSSKSPLQIEDKMMLLNYLQHQGDIIYLY